MDAREATEADAELLLDWRNDPRTRQSSRSTAVVALDEHLAWLRGVLADPQRLLLVVEHEETPVGTVRFDRRDGDGWEVSITLAPESRGRGLSGAVLAEGERAARDRLGVRTVLAAVHLDNTASAKLFERAGYAEAAPAVSGFRQLRKTLS
ncbi:RimJ/RimL family protein N-acetyltransferase [Amycolatopsis lexingtonensis]|uniref:RimJ/RimL family protein N-acetyltransferase n=1 Tax=Amycolatopsis lexingtonensis TaxID=218822 RepID=A0ABR9I8C8_9PSEU|nr:GNAT family N-acetyltransferase [Amycolatopsis lexingtonensis]MBE1499420.1 RimJ/RimL family protein N-acetyltransferase [Amycolatopsis lexingtonensis]